MDVVIPVHESPPSASGRTKAWRLLAACLILVVTLLRLAYLAYACPLDLATDEAHYWDWSRHLDWSYYSKGPLVAWLIRASCQLTGPWSRSLTGTEMLAVRLPAVLCGALLLTGLYVLTVQVWRRESLACACVAVALTLPLTAAGSALMTIDAPYTCCWTWALVFGHQAIFRRSRWAWPATGIVVGLGILAKYTMVLWVPSVSLFLLFSPAPSPAPSERFLDHDSDRRPLLFPYHYLEYPESLGDLMARPRSLRSGQTGSWPNPALEWPRDLSWKSVCLAAGLLVHRLDRRHDGVSPGSQDGGKRSLSLVALGTDVPRLFAVQRQDSRR